MGRPLERTDCDELGAYVHKRNVVCSLNLLEALRANHGHADEYEPQPAAALPPIPNCQIADAAQIAFPSWVGAIKRIQHAVCAEYGITIAQLLSHRRHKKVVLNRQIAIYLCKTLTDQSCPEIGRRFGYRDHSTVLHSISKIEAMIERDPVFAAEIERIKQNIPELGI